MRNTLLISDLHLQPDRPDITAAFVRFLHTVANQAEALFILGDLFELWIGDDFKTPLADEIAVELATLSERGAKIYLMHGNRDFLLGQDYAGRCGAQLINEPYLTEIAGHKIALLHGDILCTDDTDYMQFRALVRQRQWQQNFLSQSIPERLSFAQQARQESHQATASKSMEIMDVTEAEVKGLIEQLNVRVIIHGHTHRPAVHRVQLDGSKSEHAEATRFVLGDWDSQLWYIEISATGIELQQAPLDFSIS